MSTDNSDKISQENEDLSIEMPVSPKNEAYIYHFFVIYKKDGAELISLRKNYVEDQKVTLSTMILDYPGYTLKTVMIDYRRFADDSGTNL